MIKIFLSVFLLLQTMLCGQVYDCFTFFNELELLKLRFEELQDVVDYFVIVEGTKTFNDNDKPLFFLTNASQFEKYKEKIIHVVIDHFPENTGDELTDHWAREAHSRNCIMRGLENCKEDDIIFISDLDEIPDHKAVIEIINYLENLSRNRTNVNENSFVCELEMRWFLYYLNCENSFHLNRENSFCWTGGSKAIPYWFLKKRSPWDIKIYHHFHLDTHKICYAGWHFHAMGGAERCTYKWTNTPPAIECLEVMQGMQTDEHFFEKHIKKECAAKTKIVPIDETFPQYIRDNCEYFYSLGWIAE